MFPSLISCTTIDYYSDWPEEALYHVAKGCITEEMELEDLKENISKLMCQIHKSVSVISEKWLLQEKKFN